MKRKIVAVQEKFCKYTDENNDKKQISRVANWVAKKIGINK